MVHLPFCVFSVLQLIICLRESDVAILRRTEREMVRAMCGVKLMEKKKTEELMTMLGLKEMVDQLAKANGVR